MAWFTTIVAVSHGTTSSRFCPSVSHLDFDVASNKLATIKVVTSILCVPRISEGHKTETRGVTSNPDSLKRAVFSKKAFQFLFACAVIQTSNKNLARVIAT